MGVTGLGGGEALPLGEQVQGAQQACCDKPGHPDWPDWDALLEQFRHECVHLTTNNARPSTRISAPTGSFPVSHRRIQRQLPSETRQWMERRLHGLEQAERFEDAYALRMEMAEWLLQMDTDPPCLNLTVARLLRDRCLHPHPPVPEQG